MMQNKLKRCKKVLIFIEKLINEYLYFMQIDKLFLIQHYK